MDPTFFDGFDELYHDAKFGEDRTTRAGCRYKNMVFVCFFIFLFFTGRIATQRQTAGIKFTHRPKNQVFRPAGAIRCTDSRQTWQGRRACCSALLCKISPQSPQGVGMRPPKIKNFHFLVKSRPREAIPLTDFEKFSGLLCV